jgi:hypothetical protein
VIGRGLPDLHLPAAGSADQPDRACPIAFGGTSLLIVVNVTMDTVSQIQSHMLAHQYEGADPQIEAQAGAALGRWRGALNIILLGPPGRGKGNAGAAAGGWARHVPAFHG